MMKHALLVALVASAGTASAFTTAPALAPARANGAAVCYMQASGPASSSSRRGFLRLATAAVPALLGANAPARAAEETPVPGIVAKVLQQIAGGTQAELDAFVATPKVRQTRHRLSSLCTFTRPGTALWWAGFLSCVCMHTYDAKYVQRRRFLSPVPA